MKKVEGVIWNDLIHVLVRLRHLPVDLNPVFSYSTKGIRLHFSTLDSIVLERRVVSLTNYAE